MTPVEKSPPGGPLTMEQPSAGLDQLIADAERYKRERDEAVGLIVKLAQHKDASFFHSAVEIDSHAEYGGDEWKRDADALLTRIEQADIQNRLGTAVLTPEDAAKCIPADGRVVSVEQADKGVGL